MSSATMSTTMNTNATVTQSQLQRRLPIPVSCVVKSQEDVNYIHFSFDRIIVNRRVLILPGQYWNYERSGKLLNTHIWSDPFEPSKALVLHVRDKVQDSNAPDQTESETVLQDSRTIKRAQWQADKIAQRRELQSAKTDDVGATLQKAFHIRATEAKMGWLDRLVEPRRLKPTAKEFHPAASMQQLQQSTIQEPLRTPSPIFRAHHKTSSASIPVSFGRADRPALRPRQRASIKLAQCDTASCSSSEALSEHEDFYPVHQKKAGKAERKRQRHKQKMQQGEQHTNKFSSV